jgi:hypothetical protein
VAVSVIIGLLWILFVTAAWRSHDALAIGIAIPIVTLLTIGLLIVIWVLIGAAVSARSLIQQPGADDFAKPSS